MRIEGSIHPANELAPFTREMWCRVLERRPEFRHYAARQAPNPFAGSMATLQPPADAAEVVLDGILLGNVSWSASDEALVSVSIESSARHLVVEWAADLGGEFRQISN